MNASAPPTLYRARIVVPMCGPPIDNGAVVVRGDRIAEVGRWQDLRRQHIGGVTDLGERAVLPGLINAHCHLDYTRMRGAIPRGPSFTQWVREINSLKAQQTDADYLGAIGEGISASMRYGTTSIVNIESFPHLLPKLDFAPLRIWWCAEMIDVREPVSAVRTAANLEGDFSARAGWRGGVGLSPHALFTASEALYREAGGAQSPGRLLLTTHLAESHEETQMFRDRGGPLFKLMTEIGRPQSDGNGRTPVAVMFDLGVLTERWIVAHLNEVDDDDLALLAASPRFHIAHCPGSHAYFGHRPFRWREFSDLGFNLCLGTDSLASAESLSLFSEMRRLRTAHPSVTAREAMEAVTTNPAKALAQENELGTLQAGACADVIALPAPGPIADIYEEVVAFAADVPWLMLAGQVVTAN